MNGSRDQRGPRTPPPNEKRCMAVVYSRDTYTRKRCSRKAISGTRGRCMQHSNRDHFPIDY